MNRLIAPVMCLMLAVLALFGCDSDSSNVDDFVITYEVEFDASKLSPNVTNTYYPLTPGTTYRLKGQTEDGEELIVIEVLDDTRQVAGATTRIVLDRVFLDGELIEETFDWYAQDADGNVWYMGEDSKEYSGGSVVSSEGSWEAGIDGARAGILMPAIPTVGQAYQQEFAEGEAEDRGRVLGLGETVTVPAGTFTDCIRIEDTTPLEPDVEEHKFFCPDVGVALEVDLEDDIRFELQSIERPQAE
ncbi:MAG: hypothetical protein KJO98_05135 [Rhodothermia bacterium]|nr:hypothetical protein [Rhodothermia bacterium]